MNLRGELDHVRAMVERLEAKADDSDPVAWANARFDGFTLAPWQERVMRDEATRISLKCPRRSGKSGHSCISSSRISWLRARSNTSLAQSKCWRSSAERRDRLP